MHGRPTTEQLLNDIARELRESVMPAVGDPALVVNLEMLEQLLTSCAVRAAHEIAWMAEECDEIEAFAADVADRLGCTATAQALSAYRDGRSDSLHLDDRVENYHLASEAFGKAIDAVFAADDAELSERCAALVRARRDHETELRPGFYFPGRS